MKSHQQMNTKTNADDKAMYNKKNEQNTSMSKTSKTIAILNTEIKSANGYKSTNKDQNQSLLTLCIPSMCKSSQKRQS